MNAEEWHADIHITEALVRSCLQEQFPELIPIKAIKHIGEGWDNKVFLVNEEFIFRFPRRKIAVALLERENTVLNNLPAFLNIKIPIPEYKGSPTSSYPYIFQGYKMINGLSSYQAPLSVQDRIASLAAFAGFLKQLHNIDETHALAIGAQPQVFDRVMVNKTAKALNERVAKIIARKICCINEACFQQELITAKKIVLPADNICLVHGDLDCRHLIFNNNQLTGIIDWGDMGINNKAVDLAVVWNFYPISCHPLFFNYYGNVDAATWQYARFLGLYGAFTLMLYAEDIGDTLLMTEAINAVKRINRDLLIDD